MLLKFEKSLVILYGYGDPLCRLHVTANYLCVQFCHKHSDKTLHGKRDKTKSSAVRLHYCSKTTSWEPGLQIFQTNWVLCVIHLVVWFECI